MKAGDICKRTGIYCCGYHKKNKVRVYEGSTFKRCDYNGLKCEAFWCFLKEIKVKTREELNAEINLRRYKPRRSKKTMSEEEFRQKLMRDLDHWK
jgi:hypothetical protein